MSIYGFHHRVVCYVTRTTERGRELLVFEHADDDPQDPSGVQVPAGGMLPYESLEDAALREVKEETGLSGLTYVEQVGFVELGLYDEGGPSMSNFVHVVAPMSSEPAGSAESSEGVATWKHTVGGDGEDAGMTFACWWEPLPLTIELAGGQATFLDRLGA